MNRKVLTQRRRFFEIDFRNIPFREESVREVPSSEDTNSHSFVLRALLTIAKASVVVISLVMVTVTLAQVIFRYVIAAPLPWSEELARYCFVWIVFLGGAIGLSRGIHLGVDLFVNMLPPR